MLEPDDPRWSQLCGGYGIPYDPRPDIRRLDGPGDRAAAWDALWQELHHQGDLGEASYAAVPLLVGLPLHSQEPRWQLYSLLATIETERHRSANPGIPAWLADDYQAAWRHIRECALTDLKAATDPLLVRSALSIVALAAGHVRLGALLNFLDEAEVVELTNDRLAWAELYNPAAV